MPINKGAAVTRTPGLHDVQRLTRARVCARCPYRTPGTDFNGCDLARRCEESCALFIHLPVLREAARQLDPMVGNRHQVLQRLARRIAKQSGRPFVIARRHGARVVELLEELFS